MEYMRGLPDNAFDLAIVDPPYGIGQSGENNYRRNNLAVATNYKPFYGGDLSPPEVEYFHELFRVSINQIIWGANHFIDRINKPSPCWIVWDKDNGADFAADSELAWTSFKTAVKNFRFRWQGMLQGNMYNKEARIHPTQKPVALYKWLLMKYSKPGENILDTHMGSGSSAIAAKQFGCDFVGCEIDKYYYDKAVDRFNNETSQVELPLAQPL
jgi:site-specific DNA-methyltransferase (adenine-specific)